MRNFLQLFFSERAHVIHHVPTLDFVHPSVTGGHDPRNAFRDLPVDFAVGHRRHAFFVCEIGRLAPQIREIRFVARAGIAMTKDAIALVLFQIERFSSLDRFRSGRSGILCLVRIFRQFPGVLRKILLRRAGSGSD